jgi:hypothetical protein
MYRRGPLPGIDFDAEQSLPSEDCSTAVQVFQKGERGLPAGGDQDVIVTDPYAGKRR